MASALRRPCFDTRRTERVALRAHLRVRDADGRSIAPLARCLDIGLGGLRAVAASGPAPGAEVVVELRLASGRRLAIAGCVAWTRETLHLPLFGAPRGSDDDAVFGITFHEEDPAALLPIARLLAVRHDERRRARRVQALRGAVIHA